MIDIGKVIKGLECCLNNDCHIDKCPYCEFIDNEYVCFEDYLMRDALALLKEQEERIEIQKENFATMVAQIAVQPQIVRCRDCKYGNVTFNGIVLCSKGGMRKPDWFCADGERKGLCE